MHSGFILTALALSFIILQLSGYSTDAKKSKKKDKSSNSTSGLNKYGSIHCDDSGISFNISSKFEMKLATSCILPVMSNLKSLNAGKVMSSSNEVSPKLIQCAFKEMKCVETKTGQIIRQCVMDLKTVFIQKEKQTIYVASQESCLALHSAELKSDYKSYTKYTNCLLDSKWLKQLCPNKKVKSGSFQAGNLFNG